MDEGPFRVPRPADRRVTKSLEPEPEPARRQPEAPQLVREEPEVSHRPIPQRAAANKSKALRLLKLPIFGLIILIVIVVVGLIWSNMHSPATAIDSSKYQAILLTNGESYLGKLVPLNDRAMKLIDVYYLKPQTDTTSKASQQATTDQNNVQLIKFGGEVQGPEDEIVISKDQIVYYENLKSDGKATQAIEQYKKSH